MPSRVPIATYRLQFTPSFGFTKARELVPYLHALALPTSMPLPSSRPGRGAPTGTMSSTITLSIQS